MQRGESKAGSHSEGEDFGFGFGTGSGWASVVREVSQGEHETWSTRAVTNFSHMLALTIQSNEVVPPDRVVAELAKVQRCLFVPRAELDFRDEAAALQGRPLGALLRAWCAAVGHGSAVAVALARRL